MSQKVFNGDKKVGQSILHSAEQVLVSWLTPKIAPYTETWILTGMTILWSILAMFFGYLAIQNLQWIWGMSAAILAQYLTDLFDGAVGRYKKTGLIKWGYYADHFLDYIFVCSLMIGYSFFMPEKIHLLFYLLVVYGSFFLNAILSFSATQQFRVSYFGIGPTEVRLGFIVANTLIFFFGKTYMAEFLPYLLGLATAALLFTAWHTQREIWKMDMEEKKNSDSSE